MNVSQPYVAQLKKGRKITLPTLFRLADACGIHLRISAAAALCAVRLCPEAASAMLASHVSAEPAGRLLLEALGKRALIDAGLRLGEGSGAVAAMPLLDMALAVYSSGETFSDRGIEPYIKLS